VELTILIKVRAALGRLQGGTNTVEHVEDLNGSSKWVPYVLRVAATDRLRNCAERRHIAVALAVESRDLR